MGYSHRVMVVWRECPDRYAPRNIIQTALKNGSSRLSPSAPKTAVRCGISRQVLSKMASTDRDALVALYNAAGGAEWTNKESWTTDAKLSDWHGVDVDGEGRVVKLDLGGNNLRGDRFSHAVFSALPEHVTKSGRY